MPTAKVEMLIIFLSEPVHAHISPPSKEDAVMKIVILNDHMAAGPDFHEVLISELIAFLG